MEVERIYEKTFYLLIVLGLLHLLDLVDASLTGSGNTCKIDGNIVAALTIEPGRQRSVGGVEGEGVDERPAGSLLQIGLSRGEAAPANNPMVRALKRQKYDFSEPRA